MCELSTFNGPSKNLSEKWYVFDCFFPSWLFTYVSLFYEGFFRNSYVFIQKSSTDSAHPHNLFFYKQIELFNPFKCFANLFPHTFHPTIKMHFLFLFKIIQTVYIFSYKVPLFFLSYQFLPNNKYTHFFLKPLSLRNFWEKHGRGPHSCRQHSECSVKRSI
jgi:hypothetical protein